MGGAYCNFYSYAAAKEIIEKSDMGKVRKENLQKFLLAVIRRQEKTYGDKSIEYYRRLLREMNIHWYLIPTRWAIDRLESPVKILDKWIEQVKHNKNKMDVRKQVAQIESQFYNEQLREPEEETDVKIYLDEKGRDE